MKVISLLQPWATLVVMGAKKIETRSWNTKFRGEILIHASAKKPTRDLMYSLNPMLFEVGLLEMHEPLPLGAIVGKVEIIKTVKTEDIRFTQDTNDRSKYFLFEKKVGINHLEKAFGDYSLNRYAWLLDKPVQFKHEFEVKGQLGLWNLDEQICLMCGCTENDACFHPEEGPCSWWEPCLCSNCVSNNAKKTEMNPDDHK